MASIQLFILDMSEATNSQNPKVIAVVGGGLVSDYLP